MKDFPEPSLEELLWTLSIARLIFGKDMNIQAPPNLSPDSIPQIINAGINDWGGISPVTPDYVNPEAPWPSIVTLSNACNKVNRNLIERLASYPEYSLNPFEWHTKEIGKKMIQSIDSIGFARENNWSPGNEETVPILIDKNIVQSISTFNG